MEGSRFDLVVLGSGPAGQKAAIQAAKVGASVAVVERRDTIGGVCANTGTIPSKTLREAAIYLTGLSERGLYGQSYRVKEEITIDDLIWRTQQVMAREVDVIRNQLARNHIRVLPGQGRLADAHHVEVSDLQGGLRTVAGRPDRDRDRHDARPTRRGSSSTRPPSSTPTASCSCRASPRRSSWSAPA